MARVIRARPVNVSSARLISGSSDSLRMPADTILFVGTRRVKLCLTKLITKSSSLRPAISWTSIDTISPTPWAGYTMDSPILNPWHSVILSLEVIPNAPLATEENHGNGNRADRFKSVDRIVVLFSQMRVDNNGWIMD